MSCLVYSIVLVYFFSIDFRKYKVNIPYKIKKKKKFWKRIGLGINGGIHYVHYIKHMIIKNIILKCLLQKL